MNDFAREIDKLVTRYYGMLIRAPSVGGGNDYYTAERCLSDILDAVERERFREMVAQPRESGAR